MWKSPPILFRKLKFKLYILCAAPLYLHVRRQRTLTFRKLFHLERFFENLFWESIFWWNYNSTKNIIFAYFFMAFKFNFISTIKFTLMLFVLITQTTSYCKIIPILFGIIKRIICFSKSWLIFKFNQDIFLFP